MASYNMVNEVMAFTLLQHLQPQLPIIQIWSYYNATIKSHSLKGLNLDLSVFWGDFYGQFK